MIYTCIQYTETILFAVGSKSKGASSILSLNIFVVMVFFNITLFIPNMFVYLCWLLSVFLNHQALINNLSTHITGGNWGICLDYQQVQGNHVTKTPFLFETVFHYMIRNASLFLWWTIPHPLLNATGALFS